MNNEEKLVTLFKAIAYLDSPQQAAAFLTDLCTPQELTALADRWLVVVKLTEGRSYREISLLTGASTTTITRIARCLHLGTGGYQHMLEKMA
jgi:TrpR-related protein YerC/YecD